MVVTGAGIITSMGLGWRANAEGFRSGTTALRPVSLFDVSRQRAKIAGELELPSTPPTGALSARYASRLDRATAMVLHAGDEALQAAGWGHGITDSTPLCLGTSAGAMELGQDFYRHSREGNIRRGQATRVNGYQTQRQAAKVADAFEIGGSSTIISNACASGANAIGHGFQLISKGRANRVFAGGYDALCHMVYAGFDSLQALSTTRPRPFAVDRDGLAIGEGAAMLCLESLESARGRGARVIAEVAGYGAATDVHHLTQPHPEGDAALRSMRHACSVAGVSPDEVGYINSHGTGTPLNDVAEANAICRWREAAPGTLAVSSTKGAIGHLLGGAGAVEAVICLMALDGGWIPPNVPMDEADPACQFDLVTEARDAPDLEVALSNSFGFGGANATLVFRKVSV